jgi:hypothetical protein
VHRRSAALAVTAAVAGTLCAHPLWVQFRGPQAYRGLQIFHSWGEDLATYVTLPRDTLGGTAASESTVGLIEQNSWFGWPLTSVVMILVVVLWRRSVVTRIAGVVGLVFAVGALGPRIRLSDRVTHLPGPWAILPDRLPVLGLLMPSRLSTAVVGVFVVMVALAWDAFARRDRPAGTLHPDLPRLGRMVIVAALVPLIPTPVPAMDVPRPPQFITSGAWRPYVPAGRTLVPVPLPDSFTGRETLGWSAAALHEFPVPRGYFLGPDGHGDGRMGPAVRSYTAELFARAVRTGSAPVVTPQTREIVLGEIRSWHGSVIVLRVDPAQPVLLAVLEQMFGPGRRDLDVWVWEVDTL